MSSEASIQALQNEDLLREIFQNVESGPKLQLLALALTCRAFVEPAQDSLWKTMSCLLPFLSLIPYFVNTHTGRLEFLHWNERPLRDYRRFEAHALRLRRLEIPLKRAYYCLPPIILEQLLTFKGGEPLFPGLRQVVFETDFCITPDLSLLKGSPVVSLESTIGTAVNLFKSTLKHVGVGGEFPLPSRLVQYLGTLSALRSLTLAAPHSGDLGSLSLNGLRNLEELKMKVSQAFMLDFLLRVPSKKLRHVTLIRTDRARRWEGFAPQSDTAKVPSFWHSCAQLLQDRWSDTLNSVFIDDAVRPDLEYSFPWQSFTHILYPIKGLEELGVGNLTALPVSITDQDYTHMATSWPSLRTLHIHLPHIAPPPPPMFGLSTTLTFPADAWPYPAARPPTPPPPAPPEPSHPTAQSLLTLATGCPNVESLEIYLPSLDLESTLPNVDGRCNLRRIWLGYCEAGVNPSATAMRLTTIFPRLESVAGVCPAPSGTWNPIAKAGSSSGFEWMAVQPWVSAIRSIRFAERCRVVNVLVSEGVVIPGRARKWIQ